MKTSSLAIGVMVTLAAGAARACDECGGCRPVVVVVVEDDSTRIARWLSGTIEPRLPATEEYFGDPHETYGRHYARYVPRNPLLARHLRISWDEIRERRALGSRLVRSAAVWTVSRRSRQE